MARTLSINKEGVGHAMQFEALTTAIAVAAPLIAAVVAFALQLRQLRQARLQSSKLLLEIDSLKQTMAREALQKEKLALEVEDLKTRADVSELTRKKLEAEVSELAERARTDWLLRNKLSIDDVLKYGKDSQFRRAVEKFSEPRGRAQLSRSMLRDGDRPSELREDYAERMERYQDYLIARLEEFAWHAGDLEGPPRQLKLGRLPMAPRNKPVLPAADSHRREEP